jgi:chromosome segregation ATPase
MVRTMDTNNQNRMVNIETRQESISAKQDAILEKQAEHSERTRGMEATLNNLVEIVKEKKADDKKQDEKTEKAIQDVSDRTTELEKSKAQAKGMVAALAALGTAVGGFAEHLLGKVWQ